ncbi:uncharacterized protein EI90DRAFT_2952607 [Cantharellus anzutake]|uniref:uncharacterized protein n=1 Tax=Cantharellus anzutake TaxID=1750568 RepID=UPI001905D147|nr:uncharacterized protein EI90DRAFT_2952607 [Cantharellus anzutake]KAF8311906.1 hypothetical protein EI90DRAFT_2952607 [Cantharellus anzutake]
MYIITAGVGTEEVAFPFNDNSHSHFRLSGQGCSPHDGTCCYAQPLLVPPSPARRDLATLGAVPDNDNPSVYEVSENVIHHRLEGGRRVAQSKEHYHWLKQPSVSGKGSCPLIPFFDADVVESPSQIEG